MQPIRFKLLIEKTDQDGRAPIFLIYNYNGHQFRFFTKEKCDPKHWDANRMRFREILAVFQEANEYLEPLKDWLRKVYRDYMDPSTKGCQVRFCAFPVVRATDNQAR